MRITKYAFGFLFAQVVLFAVFAIISPQKADALYTNMPSQLPQQSNQYINLADYDTCNGCGSRANLPEAHVRVYTPNNNPIGMAFELANRNTTNPCSGYRIEVTAHLDSLPGPLVQTIPVSPSSNINGCGRYDFTIPASVFRASQLSGHKHDDGRTLNEVVIKYKVIADDGGHSPAFHTWVSSGDARISYAENGRGAFPQSYYLSMPYIEQATARYINTWPSPGGLHTISAKFKPPCDLPEFTVGNTKRTRFYWADADYNKPNQPANLRGYVYEYNEDGTGQRLVTPLNLSSEDTYLVGFQDFDMQRYKKYEVVFENVNGDNGIALFAPYDMGNWYLPCDPPPADNVTCSVIITSNISGGNAVNAVQAGQPFTATFYMHNNGATTLPASRNDANGNHPLAGALILDGVWQPPNPPNISFFGMGQLNMGQAIPPGTTVARSFTQTAPNGMVSVNMRIVPGYWGQGPIGPECSATVNTFMRYDFTASAGTTLDNTESPTVANHTGAITKTGAVDVDGTSTRNYYKRRNGVNTPVVPAMLDTRTFVAPNPPTVPYNGPPYNVPPGSYTVGDMYCMDIGLDRGHGWRGPNNSYLNEGPAYATNCTPGGAPLVQNVPYVRAYGSDVVAGGGFGTTCAYSDSKILAYLHPVGKQAADNRSGSGVQLAAMALGEIRGFMSASIRNNDPNSPKDLTFAHNLNNPLGLPDPTDNNDSPLLGGSVSGDGWCLPDYFSTTQFSDGDEIVRENSTAAFNVRNGSHRTNGQTVRTIGGATLTVQSPGNGLYTNRHTLYIEGNAYIEDNIVYNPNYTNIDTIPSFTLVVRGNIYISPNVTQLDGLYIAQPTNATNGRIYTCATASGAITSAAQLYTDCGAAGVQAAADACNAGAAARQLTVNGAFLAQRVVLSRTGYSMRCSTNKEIASASRAAEVFLFSPEMYLSPPVFRPSASSTSGEYQSISVLAPFL